jgi:site-specific recombinase XerC
LATRIVPFSFLKDGTYYFTRRVPSDLRDHYETERISFSLKTKSAHQAVPRALAMASKLDEFWLRLRMSDGKVPGRHRLRTSDHLGKDLGPTFEQALATYLRVKGDGRSATFESAASRAVEYLVASKKNKPLLAYTKADATSFRDELFSRGLASGSVVRIFSSLRSVTTFALAEYGISETSPFSGIYLDRSTGGAPRQRMSIEDIRSIQTRCKELDDDLRWLVALISDTGMRLAEAAGLALNDINLDGEVPYVFVRAHSWRSLKTQSSTRKVPLVGHSLWAARQIIRSTQVALPSLATQETAAQMQIRLVLL